MTEFEGSGRALDPFTGGRSGNRAVAPRAPSATVWIESVTPVLAQGVQRKLLVVGIVLDEQNLNRL